MIRSSLTASLLSFFFFSFNASSLLHLYLLHGRRRGRRRRRREGGRTCLPGREGRPRRQSRGRQTRVAPRPRGERNCSRAPRPRAAPPPLPRSAPRPATGTPRSHSRAARCCPNRPCSPRRRARRRRLSRRCSRRRGRPNHRRRAVSKTPFTANCAAVKAATCAFEFGAAGMISGPGSCVIARAKCEGGGTTVPCRACGASREQTGGACSGHG